MSAIDLSDELIIISGAAGGLGQVISHRLAGNGATVVAVDVVENPASDTTTSDTPGDRGDNAGEIWRLRADVSREDDVRQLLDEVHKRYGRPATTVCCHAGMVQSYSILDYPADALDELFRVNVRTAFVLAQGAARRWLATGVTGQLIFTSSWVQGYPWPEIAPYCASKAALYSLMRSFAKELASAGIRANAILPGIVSVGMARRQWDEDENYRTRAQQAIALGEPQTPESVADAFVFLCSPLSSYMTGSALTVDGGCSLLGAA